MIKETRWHYYIEGADRYRVKAEYGIDYVFAGIHNQMPDFSVTGTVEHKSRNNHWYDHSGGQVTDELSAHVPEIAPYLKWHLVGPDGPMHYFANAKYWFEIAQGSRENNSPQKINPIEAFKHTIVYPGFPGDVAPAELQHDLWQAAWRAPGKLKFKGPKEWAPNTSGRSYFRNVPLELVHEWLEERLPKLVAAWVVDMGELGVLEEGE